MRPRSKKLGLLLAAVVALAPAPGAIAAPEGGGPGDFNALAMDYLADNAEAYGVGSADVADLFVMSSYTSAHNGVTHVNLNQRYDGLEVFGGTATVNILADGRVLFVGANLVGDLTAIAAAGADDLLSAADAVEAAADALALDEPAQIGVLSQRGGGARETLLSSGGISDQPIPAKLGWQSTADGLRLAWQLVIDDSSSADLWNVTIDAASGDLLDLDNWTTYDTYADLATTLFRSTGESNVLASGHRPFSNNPVDEGSAYRVLGAPLETPNDGDFVLIENPADGLASPFGWHDTDGVLGSEFTILRGNNVHAYLDQDTNNQPDFGEPQGSGTSGPGLIFDFAADLTQHSQNYREAVVTNLFYMCNVVHDVLYLYGFTEDAANFQANNYGRGEGEGDYVRCEAADGGGTNNANFSTPSGVGTPRMQMYLWPGNQFGSQNQILVEGLDPINAGWSRFGSAPYVAGHTGSLYDAGNGCAASNYDDAPAGAFVAIVIGNNSGCNNVVKATTAESAGAVGLIVSHTTGTTTPILSGGNGSLNNAAPMIPVASITLANGNAIRAAIADAAPGLLEGTVRKHPNHPGIRDGDLENGIIIHEYGHGISNRLTGGPGINCLSGNEQAGEGWSDYYAITMLADPTLDDPDGPRGMGPYALFQDSRQGNGIRPRPYSRTWSIQPFTYDSIKTGGWLNGGSLALPHGLGHGWAAVLWDMTWDLIDKHGFNPNIYDPWNTGGNNRALQYVTDGLKMQGCGPTLLVAARAILAATDALGGEDYCTVYAAFARRGFGESAVGGTTTRNDNDEAFDTDAERCLTGFLTPVHQPYGTLNQAEAGDVIPLRFNAGGGLGLAPNSPYSRLVDCATLRTVDVNQANITPRPAPVPTVRDGILAYNKPQDRYQYNWVTDPAWAGTCREVVVTRYDGVQARAFFEFAALPEEDGEG